LLLGYEALEIPCDGGFRSDLPAHHPGLPMWDSPDLRNIIVRDGENKKFPGRVAFSATPLPGPVRFLARYPLTPSIRYLIASDGRDLFKYNTGGDSWDYLTPVYIVGTAAFTHASDQVVGTGTGWTTGNCVPGMKIKRNADGVWYEVKSLVPATQTITLTIPYVEAGGAAAAYTLRQRLSAAGERWLRGCLAQGKIIVTNGVDAPLIWDGLTDTFLPLGGSPPAGRFVTTFHQRNLLVMARDPNNPRRVSNSDAAVYTQWATGLAASYDFEDSVAEFMGLEGSHEYLFLLREDGAWRGFWEGFGVGISWSRVGGIDGPAYPNTVVRLGGEARMATESPTARWAWFGVGNIHGFDAENIVAIGEPVRRWIWEMIDPTYPDNALGASIPEWGLALWSFPVMGSQGQNAQTIAYDYLRDRWFRRDVGFSAFGAYDLSPAEVEWDTLTGSVDEQTRIFDAVFSAPQPVCLVGDEQGYVYYLAFGATDAGAGITAQRQTRVLEGGRGAPYLTVGGVSVETTAPPGTRYAVAVLGADGGGSISVLATRVAVVDGEGLALARFAPVCARRLAIRVVNTEANQPFGVMGVTAWVRGRR
jgi:hypothetical protein